tara:strand:+ start:137 stop:361 length:225 start_codon:yes stop_codon:yes gene_type:complete
MIGKEVKFKDKYERVLEGIVLDDNYTLKFGGPIVDGEVTDLHGLVKVKHYETTMNIGWMNTIIEKSQIIECNNC